MGVYRRMCGPHGDPKDLYASVKNDGDKAVVYTPSGTKVYHHTTIEEVDNDLLTTIQSQPPLVERDLIPYVDEIGNYIFLTNKPKINGVVLEGDKSTEDLNIFGKISADGVFFEDGESIQEKFNKGELGTNNYAELKNKPRINGIIICDDQDAVQLGIIEDESISDITTWSSKYMQQILNNHANIVEMVGTDTNPIIASDLMVGSYVLSGKVQSSDENVTTIRIPRRQYMVNRDVENATILWDSNPYVITQHYILFSHKGLVEPQEKTLEIVTKDSLANAKLDCGIF